MSATLYQDKPSAYFGHTRRDLIALVPRKEKCRVLEIGCGRGHTLMTLKKLGVAEEVVGVEIVDMPHDGPDDALIDRYIVGNIENPALGLPTAYFDVIICGDVLEHLVDPWLAVRRLQGFLKPDGVLIASLPNVREVRTLLNVFVRGDFLYQDEGVLDRTHLRFFCKRNILALLSQQGASIDRISSDLEYKSNWRALLNRFTFGLLEEFLVTQYLMVASRGAGSR